MQQSYRDSITKAELLSLVDKLTKQVLDGEDKELVSLKVLPLLFAGAELKLFGMDVYQDYKEKLDNVDAIFVKVTDGLYKGNQGKIYFMDRNTWFNGVRNPKRKIRVLLEGSTHHDYVTIIRQYLVEMEKPCDLNN